MDAQPAGDPALRAFQITMWLFVASGVAGVLLHYQGNIAFELALNPEAAGWSCSESLSRARPRRSRQGR